jgi:hypothetical protein
MRRTKEAEISRKKHTKPSLALFLSVSSLKPNSILLYKYTGIQVYTCAPLASGHDKIESIYRQTRLNWFSLPLPLLFRPPFSTHTHTFPYNTYTYTRLFIRKRLRRLFSTDKFRLVLISTFLPLLSPPLFPHICNKVHYTYQLILSECFLSPSLSF